MSLTFISIPDGSIKRINTYTNSKCLYRFQFQMVRLKAGIRTPAVGVTLFQFQMVRLKATSPSSKPSASTIFQFQMVRLKGVCLELFDGGVLISIPDGSIKS